MQESALGYVKTWTYNFQVVHPRCVCSTLSSWKYRKVVNTQQNLY